MDGEWGGDVLDRVELLVEVGSKGYRQNCSQKLFNQKQYHETDHILEIICGSRRL